MPLVTPMYMCIVLQVMYVQLSIANILHTDSNYIDLHSGGLQCIYNVRTGVGSAIVIYLLLKTSLNLDYLWYKPYPVNTASLSKWTNIYGSLLTLFQGFHFTYTFQNSTISEGVKDVSVFIKTVWVIWLVTVNIPVNQVLSCFCSPTVPVFLVCV